MSCVMVPFGMLFRSKGWLAMSIVTAGGILLRPTLFAHMG